MVSTIVLEHKFLQFNSRLNTPAKFFSQLCQIAKVLTQIILNLKLFRFNQFNEHLYQNLNHGFKHVQV